ncbi:MAG TPA: F0F1 ATP synthase subunit A [Flavobacteriaceae bacterium]|nr:F0F1 ATP synthase subunit A [Flavobacteriaceae bacterium]
MHKNYILSLLVIGFLAVFSSFSFAQENANQEAVGEPINEKEEISEEIDLHLLDSHYFDFFADNVNGKHYGFPLPVILIDDGVKVFSAAEFDHGRKIVEKDGSYYVYYKSKIYKTDATGELSFDEHGLPTNDRPLDFSITKNVLVSFLVAVFIFFVFRSMAKTYKKQQLPKGFGRVLEPMIVFVRDDIAKSNIGPNYHKYMSYLLSIFFFILFLNVLGLMPFGVNVTGSITVTLALALITFFITQFSGNKNYWEHIFWFPDVHWLIKLILIPIEILGMLTKPFSLMIRLFANMTAGHVMMMSFIGFIFIFRNWVAGPAFFGFSLFIGVLEILVAFLQAYIFTLLSALYISAAVEEDYIPGEETDELPII